MERKTAPSCQLILSLERKYQKNKFVIIEKTIRFWKTLIVTIPFSWGILTFDIISFVDFPVKTNYELQH
jgi:hypothetical protein